MTIRNILQGVLLACAFAAHPAMASDADGLARAPLQRDVAAVQSNSAQPVAMAEAMNSFLDRTDQPMLAVDLQCNAGRAVVAVQQSRHLPLSLTAEPAHSWNVPSCVHYA